MAASGADKQQRPARKQPSRLSFLLAAFASVFAVYWAWRIVRMAQLADGELEAFLHDREEPASVELTNQVYLRAGAKQHARP